MNQQIIIGGKRSGKTTEIIKLSAKTGRYILVSNHNEAANLVKLARELGLNVPYPITVQEVVSDKLKGSSIRRDGLYVDNALDILEKIIAVPIVGASINREVSE